jgi:hypothetical protein
VDQSGAELVVTVIGPGEAPPPADLKATVRKLVPQYIPVSLVEDSGRTTDL